MYLPLLFFPIYVLFEIQNCINATCIMIYVIYVIIEPFFLYKCICGNRYIIGIFLICKTAIMAFACAFHAFFFQNKYSILITRLKFFTYTITVVFSLLLIRKKVYYVVGVYDHIKFIRKRPKCFVVD